MRSEPRDSSTRGAIVLLVAAGLALAWASSPWGASYEALWQRQLGARLAGHEVDVSLRFVVDEGLMTVFFFAVGLEIRHEVHVGVLSEWRRAVVPLVAAFGGMLAPALIYLALNRSGPQRAGWGVPVATDIAFAVGVLALLGKRVPPALRVLLLALAIIDDIGAIVVIALFYSSGIAWTGVVVAAAGVALVFALQKLGARSPWLFVVPGVVVWSGVLRAGVHPTIAGVLLGLLTPAAVTPPLVARLRPWIAFGIMPLFALANAGVAIRASALDGGMLVPLGIVLGLVVGKPVGILVVTWVVTRTHLATLPRGITGASLVVLGCVAGVGFTMSIFIAGLAFPASSLLETSKLAILAASVLAGTIALVIGRIVLRPPPGGDAGAEGDPERSPAA